MPGFTVLYHLIYWSLFKFMSIESVMPSNHLILCRPLLLLPSVFPSIRVCHLCICQTKCPLTEEWTYPRTRTSMHVCTQWNISHKRNKLAPFAEMWVDLEAAIQSEVSQSEKHKYPVLTHICADFKKWYRWFYLQSRNRDREIENNCISFCNLLLWEPFLTAAHKLPHPLLMDYCKLHKGWLSLLWLIIKHPAFPQRVG